MEVKSILCDAATVREGLLHILGGGITRIWRQSYPAEFTGALAIMVHPHPAELGMDHQFVIQIQNQDGKLVQRIEAGLRMEPGEKAQPGETLAIPLIIDFSKPPLSIPAVGGYSIDVLVDQQHKDSLTFYASEQKP